MTMSKALSHTLRHFTRRPHDPAARRRRTVLLVLAAVLAITVHLGLGGLLFAGSPWPTLTADLVLAVIAVKVIAVIAAFALRRIATTRRKPVTDHQQTRATAIIPTTRSERYAKQLCQHAAHMACQADWTAPTGIIEFPDSMGTCRLTAEAERLVLTVDGSSPANLDRMRQILEHDIERFARRDTLTVQWQPS